MANVESPESKQSVFHELNTQLQIRAQKIRLKSRNDYTHFDDEDDAEGERC